MVSLAQVVAISTAVLILIIVVDLVRRRRLKEKHAFFWFIAGFVILSIAIFLYRIGPVLNRLGIEDPGIFFLFLGFSFLFVAALYQAVQLSKLSDDIKVLVQRTGIVQAEIFELRSSTRPSHLGNDRD